MILSKQCVVICQTSPQEKRSRKAILHPPRDRFVNETIPVNIPMSTQRPPFRSTIQGYNTGNLQQVIKRKAPRQQTTLELSDRQDGKKKKRNSQ